MVVLSAGWSMTQLPRILYGLDEAFALFRYERGARRARLVVRCRELYRFCAAGVAATQPILIGAPLILGEINACPFEMSNLVPIIVNGYALDRMKTQGVQWYLRYHRIQPLGCRSIRFESGTKTVYATHTAYFSIEMLKQMIREGWNEPNASSSFPRGG